MIASVDAGGGAGQRSFDTPSAARKSKTKAGAIEAGRTDDQRVLRLLVLELVDLREDLRDFLAKRLEDFEDLLLRLLRLRLLDLGHRARASVTAETDRSNRRFVFGVPSRPKITARRASLAVTRDDARRRDVRHRARGVRIVHRRRRRGFARVRARVLARALEARARGAGRLLLPRRRSARGIVRGPARVPVPAIEGHVLGAREAQRARPTHAVEEPLQREGVPNGVARGQAHGQPARGQDPAGRGRVPRGLLRRASMRRAPRASQPGRSVAFGFARGPESEQRRRRRRRGRETSASRAVRREQARGRAALLRDADARVLPFGRRRGERRRPRGRGRAGTAPRGDCARTSPGTTAISSRAMRSRGCSRSWTGII